MSEGSLIDRIRAQVDALTPEQVKEQYAALQERKAKELAKAKERRASMTDEQKEKARERSRAYLQTDEAKARAKAYREREDVKAKTREREKARREATKLIVEKAKALGITADNGGAPAGEATATAPEAAPVHEPEGQPAGRKRNRG